MAIDVSAVAEAIENGQTLAAADQILIDPQPGTLNTRVDELLSAIQNNDCPAAGVCRTLIRLGMNFVGRDAEIVG